MKCAVMYGLSSVECVKINGYKTPMLRLSGRTTGESNGWRHSPGRRGLRQQTGGLGCQRVREAVRRWKGEQVEKQRPRHPTASDSMRECQALRVVYPGLHPRGEPAAAVCLVPHWFLCRRGWEDSVTNVSHVNTLKLHARCFSVRHFS